MNLLLGVGLWITITVLIVIAVSVAIFFAVVPVNTWMKSLVSNAYIPSRKLVGMKLRHVDVGLIVSCYINARKAGVKISLDDIETHYMAGGNIEKLIEALIVAKGAKLNLTLENAKAIDLANKDILLAVQNCVTPIVISSPPISAVACDGIELICKVRITLQPDIEKLLGGAGEETILARVGEGVVTAVGSAKSHKFVLENPDLISNAVMGEDLAKGTAYKILSIDVADIDIGRNIGAKLQAEQAEADVQIANAKAEERKAMAIAVEQEMRAKTQEMKAKLIGAESEVPKAISEAFRHGNIGVMDYYRMQNLKSDTKMRNSISNAGGNENE